MYEKALNRLDVNKTSTKEIVTKARRDKWSIHHPDRHKDISKEELEEHLK